MTNLLITFLKALLGIKPPSGNLPPPVASRGTASGDTQASLPITRDTQATSSRFQACLAEILRHEGGYVDHPADPGGPTNMGVTFATLADWRGKTITKQDVRDLTVAEAGAIYRKNYWDKVQGDALPPGVDLAVFDAAVNSGPARAAKWLQQALSVAQDGAIGPLTLAAVAKADPATLVGEICDTRMAFLRSLSTWPTFGRGWTARVTDVRAAALEVA